MSEGIKIALYGKYGGRKTLQIGHLCDLVGRDNVLIISADQGLSTVASKIEPTNVQKPVRFNPNGEDLDFQTVVVKMAEAVKRIGPHCWLCLDGGSEVHKWIKNEEFANAEAFYDKKVLIGEVPDHLKKFGRYYNRKSGDLELDAQRVYGKVGEITERMLSKLKGLPCNLYVNYLEDMQNDNDRKKVLPWGPDVPGNLGLKAVMSTFDFVGRFGYGGCDAHAPGKCAVYPDQHLYAGFDNTSREYMARTRDDRAGGVIVEPRIIDFELGKFVQKISKAHEPQAIQSATAQ